MAVTLEVGVGDLSAKLCANALVILAPFHAAGAITAGTLETFPDGLHHLLVLVEANSHNVTSFLYYYKYRWEACQCCLLSGIVVY